MNHNRAFAVLLSFVLALTSLLLIALLVDMSESRAAPLKPSVLDPNEYFPLQIGNQWVFSWTNDSYAPSPIVETIAVASEAAGQYTLHTRHSQANGQFYISAVSGYQWAGLSTSGGPNFPVPMYMLLYYLYTPENLFPASFEIDDTWEGTGSWYGVPYTGTTTAVTNTAGISLTSGGSYTNCLQLHTIITGPHSFGAGTRDAWFAPNVGLVKLVYNHNDGTVTEAELLMGPQIREVFLPLVVRNFETVPPMVSSTYPPDGAMGVSRNLTNLSITFSEPMNPWEWSVNYGGLGDFDIGYDSSSYTFVFTRTTPGSLLSSWTYTVTVNEGGTGGFVDLSGNRAPTTYFSFTTEN